MAELLVRARDKVSSDPRQDAALTKMYDVIVVVPDGWAWSHLELSSPDWRIIKLPRISHELLDALEASEPGDPQVKTMLLRRKRRLKLSHIDIPESVRDWWRDSSRKDPAKTLNVTLAWLQANAIEEKDSLPEPLSEPRP